MDTETALDPSSTSGVSAGYRYYRADRSEHPPHCTVAAWARNDPCTFELGRACAIFGLPRPEPDRPRYRLEVCAALPGPLGAAGGPTVGTPCDLDESSPCHRAVPRQPSHAPSRRGAFLKIEGEMAITYDSMMSYAVPEVTRTLSDTDCILYALGVGFGSEPEHPGHLRYVYEDGLEVLPMMANVTAYPGFWLRDPATGVDWKRVLHGEQVFTVHRPIPFGVKLAGRTRIVGIDDKGAAFGAFMFARRDVVAHGTDEVVCTLEQTTLLRGDGGCGGSDARPRPVHRLPRREPDLHHDLAVAPPAALVYRLSGDRNPLHVDPAVAKAAGFERPILHGMCTMGYAGHSVMAAVCGYDGGRIRTMQVRFIAPAYPGETLRTEMWIDGGVVSFRTRALERDTLVLGNGRIELR